MHKVGFIMHEFNRIKLAENSGLEDLEMALDAFTHQQLSNVFHLMRMNHTEYNIMTKNLIRLYFKNRFRSIAMPMKISSSHTEIIEKIKKHATIENRLYEHGSDIMYEGKVIGEIV